MTHSELIEFLRDRQPTRNWRMSLHVGFRHNDWAIGGKDGDHAFAIMFHEGIEPSDIDPEALLRLIRPRA